jgi:hypothetical protein
MISDEELFSRLGEIPMWQVLLVGAIRFKDQPDRLRYFIRELSGHSTKRGPGDMIVLVWQGFDILESPCCRAWPPLSRWNGPAAWQLIKTITREPGLTYETYRQRVRRAQLHQLKPILVQKIDLRTAAITYTPMGMKWLRENHSLGAVTRNGKKMSHDRETSTRFNAANGNGKIAKNNFRANSRKAA